MKRIIYSIRKALRFLGNSFRDFCRCDMFVYSANAALWLLMAALPLLMLVLSVLRFFPRLSAEQLHEFMQELFPTIPAVGVFVAGVSDDLGNGASAAVSWISGFATLFSASAGIFAVMKGLARLNGIENQSWMKYRLIAIGYTLLLLIMILLTLGSRLAAGILVSLVRSKTELPVMQKISGTLISFLGYCHIITLTGIFLMAWFLYLFPFKKTQQFGRLIPGAAFTCVTWFAVGKLFPLFIARFWKKSVIYGSLTALVLVILWVFLLMVALFFGAALNKSLRAHTASCFEKQTETVPGIRRRAAMK